MSNSTPPHFPAFLAACPGAPHCSTPEARAARAAKEDVGCLFWDSSPDLLGSFGPTGALEAANDAWKATLGWEPGEIRQNGLSGLAHPDDKSAVDAMLSKTAVGDPYARCEVRMLRKDGGVEWINWCCSPSNRPAAYYCSGRARTHERRQAAELSATTARLSQIWRLSRDALTVSDLQGTLLEASPAWEAILGIPPEAVVGRNFLELVWPEDQDRSLAALGMAASPAGLSHFENRYAHKDGTPRWLSWQCIAHEGLIYCSARDVTEYRAAQEALRQSQKMEAIGQLTGGIAHDFNNLLQVISGNLHLISQASGLAGDEKCARRLESSKKAVRQGAKLSSSLLAFGRRQALDPKPLDVGELARGMEDLLSRALGEEIDIAVQAPDNLWTTLADPAQLENAILNLAINARDAMDGRGSLRIRAGNLTLGPGDRRAGPGDYVEIVVEDTGPGFPAETAARAFEPFFTTKPAGHGTGLGLAMVYGFAAQSGGAARIESGTGRGARVHLLLPRTWSHAEQSVDLDGEPALGGHESIMVVEDDDDVRETVASTLQELGYHVSLARDARGAIDMLRTGDPVDLLLTDVVMPGPATCLELAAYARSLARPPAVVFTSGYAQSAIVHGGRLDAGVDLLAKPYGRDALARKARAALDARPPPGIGEPARAPA